MNDNGGQKIMQNVVQNELKTNAKCTLKNNT